MKFQGITCEKPTNRSYVGEYIYRKIKNNNENFLGGFVGQTGSGKSYASLAIAEEVDPEFKIEHVAFSTAEFMRILKKLQDMMKIGIDIDGTVIVFDEVQVSQSSRDFMRRTNKMFNYVLSTFRNMNLCVFLTLPTFAMLDSQSRGLMHGVFQSMKNRNKDFRVFSFRLLETNPMTSKLYSKKLRVLEKWNQRLVCVDMIKIYRPTRALVRAYEEKKNAFTRQLNESINRDLNVDNVQTSYLHQKK